MCWGFQAYSWHCPPQCLANVKSIAPYWRYFFAWVNHDNKTPWGNFFVNCCYKHQPILIDSMEQFDGDLLRETTKCPVTTGQHDFLAGRAGPFCHVCWGTTGKHLSIQIRKSSVVIVRQNLLILNVISFCVVLKIQLSLTYTFTFLYNHTVSRDINTQRQSILHG